MINNFNKIEKYINQTKNRYNLESANKDLLELFGDEETYNRFVLINLNSKITSAFDVTRGDGLYMSCEMALHNFEGSYMDFARFHNSTRFSYSVVQTALDNFYNLELRLFVCGTSDPTNKFIRRVAYYDLYSDRYSETVYTPQIITINKNHPNMSKLAELGLSRSKNMPILNMDANTLSAFTQFRIMAYNYTKMYLENGYEEELQKLNPSIKVKDNPYIAYALALHKTCEFFKDFYPPENVKFTNTNLPYKGLKVIEQKVKTIKENYGIETIGTIRHFSSANNLPFINQSLYHIANVITKMVEFKGKYVKDKFLYRKVHDSIEDIIYPPVDIIFDEQGRHKAVITKPTPKINIEEVKTSQTETQEIDKVLTTTTKILDSKYTFKVVPTIEDECEKIKRTKDINYKLLKKFENEIFLIDVVRKKAQEALKEAQLPMFIDVRTIDGCKYFNNVEGYATNNYANVISLLNKASVIYRKILSAENELLESSKMIKTNTEKIESLESQPKDKDTTKEHTFIDVETGKEVKGDETSYNLNEEKKLYIKNVDSALQTIEELGKLKNELHSQINECDTDLCYLLECAGFEIEDFGGAYESVQDILNSEILADVNPTSDN